MFARSIFPDKMTEDGVQRAIGCFQSALREDPECGLAQSGLADRYCQLALWGSVCAADVCGNAREFAAAAVRSDLAEAYVASGRVSLIFDWNGSKAREDFRRALELNPSLPEVYRACELSAAIRGEGEDALEKISQAQELDPLSIPIGIERAWLLYLGRKFDQAVKQSWSVLSLEPSCALMQTIWGLLIANWGRWRKELRNSRMRVCVLTGIRERWRRLGMGTGLWEGWKKREGCSRN